MKDSLVMDCLFIKSRESSSRQTSEQYQIKKEAHYGDHIDVTEISVAVVVVDVMSVKKSTVLGVGLQRDSLLASRCSI